jgi:hypothetical protein
MLAEASELLNDDGWTVTVYCLSTAPAAFKAATVVRPGATPKTNKADALAGRTSTTFGSATKTFAAGPGIVITRPSPAVIVRLENAPGSLGAGAAAGGGAASDAGGNPNRPTANATDLITRRALTIKT